MAKDEISVILANKSEIKAKNFIILISFYGNWHVYNTSNISFFIRISFFFEDFFKVSKEQKTINEI